ncbi:MAG TPA: Rne/Rng family ribonuclease [Polyangiaceae bacterium]
MAKNLLVINVDLRETRVALIEDGIIAELHLERASTRSTLGNIVLGRVTRVLPGMQAAFIDIGQERAAFLHVEDLIRPHDFEAYLAGGKRPDEEDNFQELPAASPEVVPEPPEPPGSIMTNGVEAEIAEADESILESDVDDESPDDELADAGEDEEEADEAEALEVPDELVSDAESDLVGVPEVQPARRHAASEAILAVPERPAVPEPPRGGRAKADLRVEPVSSSEPRVYRSKRAARLRQKKGNGRGAKPGRGRNGQRDASRLSRSTPIREVVREGQEVIVQVSKEPIGTKGARVTSHVSLPGRYVVYMPTIDQIGISKRIGSEKERARLREAIESIKPPKGGLIVRTVAEGLTKKQLKADVGYLVRLWEEVARKRDSGGRAPTLLYQELDLVLKTARDLFTDDIEQIVIDDREQYQRLVRFVEMFMPERVKDIIYYGGDEPIFDAYGIEDEIGRALSRKVPLTSGGYLIIDQAEALTAIDVNTGRYVGKGSKDLEDTLFKTNLEAVEEIAYQLRFRNLGGLIVLDLIDMERASNREKIRRRLEELLQKDKAKTTLNRISDLGLIEMTRKRTRESLGRLLHEPCFYCDGTGQLQSKQTVVYEILRQIRRDRAYLPGYSVVVNAHPAVIDLMKGEERESVQEAERRFMRRIELVPRKEYHLEQFDLAGK